MTDSRLGPLVGPEGYDPVWDDQRGMHRDRKGDPMTLREWVTGIENSDYRFVAQDEINGVKVITAWLGMVDPLDDDDQLFGTICRSKDGGFYDERQTGTEAEALAEHRRRVDALSQCERGHDRGPDPTGCIYCCERCNHDTHACRGCGEPLRHDGSERDGMEHPDCT